MTERWKSFWLGVGSALGALATALTLILTLRRRGGTIADDTEKKIERTREELRKSSDEALAALFNRRVADAKKAGKR